MGLPQSVPDSRNLLQFGLFENAIQCAWCQIIARMSSNCNAAGFGRVFVLPMTTPIYILNDSILLQREFDGFVRQAKQTEHVNRLQVREFALAQVAS